MNDQDQMLHIEIDGLNVIIRDDGTPLTPEAIANMKKTLEDLKYKERKEGRNNG